MALDRTWFNTLVDDSGDGISGSVWDKADVDSLMDAVDAEIARIEPTSGIFTPTLGGTGGGVAGGYSIRVGVWAVSGALVYVAGRLAITSKGSIVSGLMVDDLPFLSNGNTHQSGYTVGYHYGITVAVGGISGYMDPGYHRFYLTNGGAQLQVGHVTDTFDFVFSGTYMR